jgi:hypothetical protein
LLKLQQWVYAQEESASIGSNRVGRVMSISDSLSRRRALKDQIMDDSERVQGSVEQTEERR